MGDRYIYIYAFWMKLEDIYQSKMLETRLVYEAIGDLKLKSGISITEHVSVFSKLIKSTINGEVTT